MTQMDERPPLALGRMIALNIATLLGVLALFLLIDGLLPGRQGTFALQQVGVSVTANVEVKGTEVRYGSQHEPGILHPQMNDQLRLTLGDQDYHVKSPYLETYLKADSVSVERSYLLGFTKDIRPTQLPEGQPSDFTNESPYGLFPLVPLILLLPLVTVFLRGRRELFLKLSFLLYSPVVLYAIWRVTMLLILYKDVP
jgi:hypothetical protein